MVCACNAAAANKLQQKSVRFFMILIFNSLSFSVSSGSITHPKPGDHESADENH
jgi:hypothetical protein